MSTEIIKNMLEELEKNPEAKSAITENGNPKTIREYAEAILTAAKKAGIKTQIDAGELAEYLEAADASRKVSTDQAVDDLVSLEDDDVEAIAGGRGKLPGGKATIPENFWACFINDKCSSFWN